MQRFKKTSNKNEQNYEKRNDRDQVKNKQEDDGLVRWSQRRKSLPTQHRGWSLVNITRTLGPWEFSRQLTTTPHRNSTMITVRLISTNDLAVWMFGKVRWPRAIQRNKPMGLILLVRHHNSHKATLNNKGNSSIYQSRSSQLLPALTTSTTPLHNTNQTETLHVRTM